RAASRDRSRDGTASRKRSRSNWSRLSPQFRKTIVGAAAILILAVLLACLISSCSHKMAEKRDQQEREAAALAQQQLAAQEAAANVKAHLAEADRMAASYDYDGAIEHIKSVGSNYASYPELTEAIEKYEQEKTTMVLWPDNTQIPHIFFHSLIVDTARAFDGENTQNGYNLNMATCDEFRGILNEMYNNGYVLVSIYDVASPQTQADGTVVYKPGQIWLPAGKKPFVMSEDDVCYYEYMVDGDEDHYPDKDGDGFPYKLMIDPSSGKVINAYIDAEGNTLYGEYDLMPILESFIKEHPDFSYRGARAILAFTGYQGALGYRTHPDWEAILGTQAWQQEKEDAIKVANRLKEMGYLMASHSFGHPDYGAMDISKFHEDVQKWEDQIEPIVGETDILIYPFGADIAGVEDYSGERYQTLYDAGFRYFCNVDSSKYWVQIRDDYVRQGRRNVDGYRMYWNPDKLSDLFDVSKVYDNTRPTMPEWQ
ncbi:MAG: polysaccharide deacetylase, partial [Oscillospiraceae bacterium]|nr:polysaccharide deacetylase [Oscillospiraceae bacterium]